MTMPSLERPAVKLTFICVVPGRSLQQGHAGREGDALAAVSVQGVQASPAATLLVGLALLALHLLLVGGPALELLRPSFLGRPQTLQAGHLVQLLQLMQQLQVVGHGCLSGCSDCSDAWAAEEEEKEKEGEEEGFLARVVP